MNSEAYAFQNGSARATTFAKAGSAKHMILLM